MCVALSNRTDEVSDENSRRKRGSSRRFGRSAGLVSSLHPRERRPAGLPKAAPATGRMWRRWSRWAVLAEARFLPINFVNIPTAPQSRGLSGPGARSCRTGVRRSEPKNRNTNERSTVKTLNPSIERLEERVAPDLLDIGGTIGVIVNVTAGVGNGTSCYTNSDSSGCNSTNYTDSGTCHCWRHSH
jgi:hypothetical protein